ncbi:MAG: methylated-DNA--[protein]-cysteine S-methyltransferase [Rubrivivax sp.]|nr:methylated-DNA--[protein]-cysteine S-methyltransferase [Rubrivivax sp.]
MDDSSFDLGDDAVLPPPRHCAMFDTLLGPCGIAWRGEAVTLLLLPTVDREATFEQLTWQSGSEVAPPPWPGFVTGAMSEVQALLRGEPADLRGVPLDWAGIGQFERKVYEAARRVLPGHVCTYEELAQVMNAPGSARAVDLALARNPWPLLVPCHRVVAGGGRLGSFSSAGGLGLKKWLIEREAAMFKGPPRAAAPDAPAGNPGAAGGGT